jgi:hypothetical protein
MPLMRYFCYVGGILLALLFIADAYFPKLPDALSARTVSYIIRIHSDRKWPERVVYDTSHPTVTHAIPAQIANIAASAPAPATIAPLKVREREAFAQLRPPDASQLQSSDSKKREPKGHRPRNIAKRHPPPPVLLVARQRQFGWFAYW